MCRGRVPTLRVYRTGYSEGRVLYRESLRESSDQGPDLMSCQPEL